MLCPMLTYMSASRSISDEQSLFFSTGEVVSCNRFSCSAILLVALAAELAPSG